MDEFFNENNSKCDIQDVPVMRVSDIRFAAYTGPNFKGTTHKISRITDDHIRAAKFSHRKMF
jgi:hypothetical protein